MDYYAYIKSNEWQVLRRVKLDQAEHRCQLCNRAGDLNVHHRTYERLGQEKLSDLIVLCSDCHSRFHFPEPQPDPEVAYRFRLDDGSVGRLKQKDLEKWREQYSVDVDEELSGIAQHSQVKPLKKKGWFFQVAGALKRAEGVVSA